jgi:hypothetical protein
MALGQEFCQMMFLLAKATAHSNTLGFIDQIEWLVQVVCYYESPNLHDPNNLSCLSGSKLSLMLGILLESQIWSSW